MHLCYFDENKPSPDCNFFSIGGVLIKDTDVLQAEKTLSQIVYNFFNTSVLNKATELHGKCIFHGKENFKNKKMGERIKLLEDLSTFIINNKIPIRIVSIDIAAHKLKYTYPEPEYTLGLMLLLERFCDHLDSVNDLGIAFGDYEGDQITKSILDFSQFKFQGRTPMYYGRPLGRLIDSIYFTHSHHSRFLQIADIIVFLANRCENSIVERNKWHEQEIRKIWQKIKNGTDFKIQKWP
ncbi:MAG: DUF3800 domain-containing protein [Atribacterota bacterium]|nr:DUF3800 domain-containing protein [Atribacterota bacterium]